MLPYFPDHFTIQLAFLPYFSYLVTIPLVFLPYCPYLITIRLAFLPYFSISFHWKMRKKIVKRYGKYGREAS
jgi:hypothetical protein